MRALHPPFSLPTANDDPTHLMMMTFPPLPSLIATPANPPPSQGPTTQAGSDAPRLTAAPVSAPPLPPAPGLGAHVAGAAAWPTFGSPKTASWSSPGPAPTAALIHPPAPPSAGALAPDHRPSLSSSPIKVDAGAADTLSANTDAMKTVTAAGAVGAMYMDEPPAWENFEQFRSFLVWCHQNDINDISLSTNKAILCKRHGDYRPRTKRDLTSNDMNNIFRWCKEGSFLSPGDTYRGEQKVFVRQEDLERLRLRVTMSHMTATTPGFAITLRLIPNALPTAAQLGIPADLLDAFRFKYGLGLICGKMESGKTWTQAAIIDDWVAPADCGIKVMHFGSPIEFMFDTHSGRHHITQHAIPEAIRSYPEALKIAKSSTPDRVVMEEINDSATMSMVIDTAQSGIGITGTLHISRVSGFPGAMLTYFPDPDERDARLYAAIDALQVVLVQRLEPKVDPNNPAKTVGRVCLREYLILDEAMRTAIKEHPTRQWSEVLHRLVLDHGQSMADSARTHHAAGHLSDTQLDRIIKGKA